ncbi:MAG: carboxypeptidase regulatory-like domain-containing protein [Candidatus Acidiferrales bacterium]
MKRAPMLLLALAAIFSATPAQQFRGGLVGQVLDVSGARVVGAKVLLRASGSAVERQATSNSRGEFRVDDLLPGPYVVVVTAPGLADASASVNVIVATVRNITVAMKPKSVRETVNVQGQASSITTEPVDLSSAVHQGVISSQDLETLPLAARSFANIAYVTPGTEPVEPSDPTKARITAVSTGGSSGLNNELSVDGADNSDDYIGGFLQNFSPDVVQEFAFRTAQEDADTGGTTAGSVIITTKRGTNQWHGSGAFYERAAPLNAPFPIENPAPNPKQPFSRQNYVGTLGGPIKTDKIWFFSSIEYVHEDASIAYSPASITQFNALAQLASEGLIPGVSSIAVPPNVPIPFRDYIGSLRFDWAQSGKSQWFLRTSEDNYLTHNALVQQATLPSTGLTTHNNYWNAVISNQYSFSQTWLGTLVVGLSELHLTQARNSTLGFALAFPFSSTSQTISGFETFGDNQFATPITLFPDLRNQEKYQLRYDISHVIGNHAPRFGINFIHEPVLSGAFSGNAETLYVFPLNNPTYYISQPPSVFTNDLAAGASFRPAHDGSFSQNVQRLALYAEDSWRVTRHLTVNYGLRYQTSFGLFEASGHDQALNPAFVTLRALQIPISVPHDYRAQVGPRLGIAYSPGDSGTTVIRTGFGMFYNDLAQNGWATAFQGLNPANAAKGSCTFVVSTGTPPTYSTVGPACIPGDAFGGTGDLIDGRYRTPYAIHVSAGVQHAFNQHWTLAADYTHEEGNHGYRAYTFTGGTNLFTPLIPTSDPNYASDQAAVVPDLNLFKSDNRSAYNSLMLHLQGNVSRRFNLTANYTLSKAKTWGCLLGELFDYVNGVCNPLNPFGPGDYGPSGEDVTHRFVLAGILYVPGGFELTTITQAESARPFTITNATSTGRISVNGVPESLDELRGTPYIQSDLRVSRPFKIGERWQIMPFVEFFNLFNRNNPGANYVTAIGDLPVPAAQAASGNITDLCTNAACTTTQPISSINQLRKPGGALGDFFGPGTTVGIPFAAQIGARATF